MSHTDIIWIVGTLTFASIFGPYVAIKLIKQYTRPPINTLQTSGDIELMDYIEPVRPQQTYNHQDLFEPAFPIYERFSVNYWRVPSYRSETLPSYHIKLTNYLDNKVQDAFNLFNMNFKYSYFNVFKYKSVEIDFNSYINLHKNII